MRGSRLLCFAIMVSVLRASSLSAQRRNPVPRASSQQATAIDPASKPKAGTLYWVRITDTKCTTIGSASVAGEPVHIHTMGDATFALAGIPIDSVDGVSLIVRCASGESTTTRIATQRSTYPLERLTVAPKFSAKPDSALAKRMRKEAEEALVVSRNAHVTSRLWTESFAVPRTTRITSKFGGGRTFNGTVTSRHMGTDFAGAVGEPVRAANRGIVRLIGAFYLGGNVIYLDHGEGLVTAYLHLSQQQVAVGDTVQKGEVIGKVGATGRVTGPHLHFIARYGAITVDPASLFALGNQYSLPLPQFSAAGILALRQSVMNRRGK